MSIKSRIPVVPAPAFVKGQLWKYGERCIRIEHVGKLLVEHRGVSVDQKRNVTSKRMASMKELQQFLKANDGVLISA